MKPLKMTFKAVMVKWEDAATQEDYMNLEQIDSWAEKEYLHLDLGWLIKKNKKYVLFAPSWQINEKRFNYSTKIPIGMVKEIKYL